MVNGSTTCARPRKLLKPVVKQYRRMAWRRSHVPITKGGSMHSSRRTVYRKNSVGSTKGDAYVTSDVGQHQMFAAPYYPFDKPNRWINSGRSRPMGFGCRRHAVFKTALSDAAVACRDRFEQHSDEFHELSTCCSYDLPVKIITAEPTRHWHGLSAPSGRDMQYGSRHSIHMESLPDFRFQSAESTGMYRHACQNSWKRFSKPAMEQAFANTKQLVFMDIRVETRGMFIRCTFKDGSMRDMWPEQDGRARMRTYNSVLLGKRAWRLGSRVGRVVFAAQLQHRGRCDRKRRPKIRTLSRLTLTTVGHDEVIEQDHQDLNKLIEVVKAGESVRRLAHRARADAGGKSKATVPSAPRSSGLPTSSVGRLFDVTSSVSTPWQPVRPTSWTAFIEAIARRTVIEVVPHRRSGIARGEKVLEHF